MNEKAKKILALALCSEHQGEWENAAIAFMRILREGGAKPEMFFYAQTKRLEDFTLRSCLVMPFGKHKGIKIKELPDDYLAWISGLKNLKPILSEAIKKEITRRLTK